MIATEAVEETKGAAVMVCGIECRAALAELQREKVGSRQIRAEENPSNLR